MRDLVVREAVKTMAEDAAERFRALIASGEELPYDVNESGERSPLPQYVPLTERFIREHASALRELDSFGAACAALESTEMAGAYLDQLGIAAPPEPRRRAELAIVVFLCRLWSDSTDFSLEDSRLNAAIEEMEIGGDTTEDEIEVVVPLRGLRMTVARLELATATIVHADTVDVPPEARAPDGTGSAGWEPAFLAVARVGHVEPGGGDSSTPDAGARAVEAFRQVITALRLFKPGGVGLGSHAWARSGGDRWRRIATGAGRPRSGGYRLTDDELPELIAFSRALAHRSTPFGRPAKDRPGLAGALPRSISRFEAGLERHAVLEALNDYLLAARFLLEGGGPADLGLSMRIAALCAEPARRDGTRATVDRALALERELWTGEPAPSGNGASSPAATAVELEGLVRAILKDTACGHLGSDLRATADEILLADGLAVGEGDAEQRGATAEWELPNAEEPESEELSTDPPAPGREAEEAGGIGSGAPGREAEEAGGIGSVEDLQWGELEETPLEDHPFEDHPFEDHPFEDEPFEDEPFEHEPLKVPEPAGRISVERSVELEEETVFAETPAHAHQPEPRETPTEDREEIEVEPSRARELMDARPAERERIASRVAYLFPPPETTEWTVREVAYDRTRRATPRELRAS